MAWPHLSAQRFRLLWQTMPSLSHLLPPSHCCSHMMLPHFPWRRQAFLHLPDLVCAVPSWKWSLCPQSRGRLLACPLRLHPCAPPPSCPWGHLVQASTCYISVSPPGLTFLGAVGLAYGSVLSIWPSSRSLEGTWYLWKDPSLAALTCSPCPVLSASAHCVSSSWPGVGLATKHW